MRPIRWPAAGVLRSPREWNSLQTPPVGTIRIDIADTGIGIPADLIPRVFERGFTTKSSGASRGFGLGICREIIQMHGGEIRLSSTAGSGTTVRLSLPAKS